MAASRNKPTPAVYRRRRLVALALLLVLIALLWWAVSAVIGLFHDGDHAAPGASEPAAADAPAAPSAPATVADEPAASPPAAETPAEAAPEAAPEPTPEDTGPAVCTDRDVQVTAVVDAESYAPDQRPQLSMKFVNSSDHDCAIDIGTSTQLYTVKSGEDVIWVSEHCQAEKTSQVVLLEKGKEVTTPPIEWVRERSAPDTCDSDARPAAIGGGAYYSLTVAIGGITSQPTYFELQ